MAARFLHTADWQLGKPFAGVTDVQKRSLLQQERLEVLKRIAAAAREHGAEFIVVAGDVFDSSAATKATVSAACSAIGEMKCPVFLIPGNHDHGGPGSVWEQSFLQKEQAALAPNMHILLKPEPVECDSAIILPCPLLRRHESSDTTAWLRTPNIVSDKPRIVLAHGSVQGFSASDDDGDSGDGGGVNQLDLTQLADESCDYVALGDWHGTKQVHSRAWYAGTPEPDRFPRGEANEPGHVLMVTAARGALPVVTRLKTSRIGWHRVAFHCDDETALLRLEAALQQLIANRTQQDLLRLELSGSLSLECAAALEGMLESWRARLLRLKLYDRTRLAPSPQELTNLTERASDPLIARVARRLVEYQSGDDEDAAMARTALRVLHSQLA